MNPRLKQLAQNSGFDLAADSSGDLTSNLEKFGLAVAQDCVTIVALLGISNFENDDISWAADFAITEIRKKFGVSDGSKQQ